MTAAHLRRRRRAAGTSRWRTAARYSARFLITAIGPLSAPTHAAASRACESFKGQSFHTARWPKEPVDFAGKRVAVIGTGATGVQTIQEVAKTVGHLTVFQRTPNWCAPLHNAKITRRGDGEDRRGYPRDLRALPGDLRLLPAHARSARHVRGDAEEEREAFWEKLYGERGFGIWQGNFRDILIDREANATISRLRRAQDPRSG